MSTKTKRTPRKNNKLYKCPTTAPENDLLQKERGFVLDSNAVASISNDYSRCNPRLGSVIPPYNPLKDKHARGYYRSVGVRKTLEKTGQVGNRDRLINLKLVC